MTYYDELHSRDWAEVEQSIYGRSEEDVARALANPALNLESLTTLLSPAAEGFIEEMAQRAHRLTRQRFGRVMSMFAPLYVSNVCTNSCVYCGFNVKNPVKRAVLTVDEAYEEAVSIRKMGFRHILLVAGEAPKVVPTAYFKELALRLRPLFSSISIEI
jgi:2-iminoacetate synthase